MIGHWYLNILLAWRFCEMRTLLWGCVLECTDSQIVLKIYFVTVHNYFIAYQKILILSYLTHLYELCSAILNEKNHCNQTFTTISVPAILNGGGDLKVQITEHWNKRGKTLNRQFSEIRIHSTFSDASIRTASIPNSCCGLNESSGNEIWSETWMHWSQGKRFLLWALI